jgi:NAD(P)-dependent dehydrogenase (short-subunit alcohol dehydrogenase family)
MFATVSRTVLVTGAGSGIGAAIARAFDELGDRVSAADISAERVEAVVGKLSDRARSTAVDVSDEKGIRAAVRSAHEQTGSLDVLVNVAGVADGKPEFVETTTELWRRILDVNLSGTFYASQEAARVMLEQGSGRIINMASISTFSGRPNGVAYTVSKAGILGLTTRMAWELGAHGITVNVILPGAISTGIGANTPELLGDLFPQSSGTLMTAADLASLVPVGRRGTAEEVAAAAVFLASEAASYVNGVALPVDGGYLAG